MEANAMWEGVRNDARNELRLSILTAAKSLPLTMTSFVPCFGQCTRMTTTAFLRICKRSRRAMQRTAMRFDPR